MGMQPIGLSRRALLGGAAAMCLARAAHSSEEPARRPLAIDWVSGQNLLALGIAPLAMPEIERYSQLVVEPAPASDMRELGLRSEPNLELIHRLKPKLVVMNGDLAPMRERLAAIAPICSFDPDHFGESGRLAHARLALSALAGQLGASGAFGRFMQTLDAELAAGKRLMARYDRRPLYVATVIDGRRLLIFGRNSLFQDVLDHFGIENAWAGSVSRYGHTTVSADRLAARPDARLLCVGDTSRDTLKSLLESPVIASLPFVKQNRIVRIPDVLFYGGLPPVRRFARLASAALSAGGPNG
ncbi:ABC transporter substrate-binding protein [Labrys neptuniae]|uniref:ABC transporter substrate-binding protein n=1 Tax=Labrys neptuniae TaxID=376174 RepID=A0ABV3PP04_9HYPH